MGLKMPSNQYSEGICGLASISSSAQGGGKKSIKVLPERQGQTKDTRNMTLTLDKPFNNDQPRIKQQLAKLIFGPLT